jgi:dTMP kinase
MVTLRRGVLIVFEGIDGAGKTTQAKLLYEMLKRANHQVVLSKEPTEGRWGMKVKQLIEHGRDGIPPDEELEWFLRDRQEHVARIISPGLQQKKIVILDRYYLSTMAYQGSLGIDPETIERKNLEFAPPPDLLFLIEIPPHLGVRRKEEHKGRKTDSFEQEQYLFQVSKIFNDYHRQFVHRLAGNQSMDRIGTQAWEITTQYLRDHDLLVGQ